MWDPLPWQYFGLSGVRDFGRLQYTQCPSDTDLLLNYFNNHNGGLFQNTLPSVTNEVPTIPTYKYMMSWA